MHVVFKKKLPSKCKDLLMSFVPCKIRNLCFDEVILDLGAYTDLLPRSIYDKINLGVLRKTGLIIDLTDSSNAYLDGVLEYVLVQLK